MQEKEASPALRRGLKNRHLQMIALGGAIGNLYDRILHGKGGENVAAVLSAVADVFDGFHGFQPL